MLVANFTYRFINSLFSNRFMVTYRLTCKNCDMDHTHEVEQIEGVSEFWKNWNKAHGENMKCIHDYVIETLN